MGRHEKHRHSPFRAGQRTAKACRAATAMASSGAGRPNTRSNCRPAWWTSMPSPPTAVRPRCPGGRHQRGHLGLVDQIGDHRVRPAGPRRRPAASGRRPCRPAWRSPPGRPPRRRHGPAQSSGGTGQSGGPLAPGRRAIHHDDFARAGTSQGQDDRSCRASGPEHHAGPAGRDRTPSRPSSARRNPSPSVLSPTNTPLSLTTQFTASSAAASSLSRSTPSRDRRLVRHRHRQPSEVERSHGIECRRRVPVGHLERHEDPVDIGRRERGVVDGGRQRVPDRITDDRAHASVTRRPISSGADPRPGGRGAQSKPACWARWRALSNSEELSVKKW